MSRSVWSKIGLQGQFTGGQLGRLRVLGEKTHSSITLRECQKQSFTLLLYQNNVATLSLTSATYRE